MPSLVLRETDFLREASHCLQGNNREAVPFQVSVLHLLKVNVLPPHVDSHSNALAVPYLVKTGLQREDTATWTAV